MTDANGGTVTSLPIPVAPVATTTSSGNSRNSPILLDPPSSRKHTLQDVVVHAQPNENVAYVHSYQFLPQPPQPPAAKRQRLEATDSGRAETNNNNLSPNNTNARRRLALFIMFDGGSRGNPGLGGAGAFVTARTTEISATNRDTETFRRTLHVRYYLGADKVTNNQAEYQGLLYGLKAAKREVQRESERLPTGTAMPIDLVVQGDSNLIIEQLKGSYNVKSPKLLPLYRQAKQLLEFFGTVGPLNLSLEHVYRDHNKVADGTYREKLCRVTCRIIPAVVWTRMKHLVVR
jgi:ribonuclease HI